MTVQVTTGNMRAVRFAGAVALAMAVLPRPLAALTLKGETPTARAAEARRYLATQRNMEEFSLPCRFVVARREGRDSQSGGRTEI